MTILWWHWLLLGLILAIAELAAAGGFYLLFFGIGAALVGLLAALGVAGPAWMQTLLFAALSVGSLVLFRKSLLKAVQPDPQAPAIDTLVGEFGSVVDTLSPGAIGRVELRGTVWSALNRGSGPLAAGTRCRITGVDGLLLHVEPEGVR